MKIVTTQDVLRKQAEVSGTTPGKIIVLTTQDLHHTAEVKRNFSEVQQLVRVSNNKYLKDLVGEKCLADAPVVVIIAGGPSVNEVDLDILEGAVVIGVNRGFELDCTGINVSVDLHFKKWIFEKRYGQDVLERWLTWDGVKVFNVLPNTPVPENGEDPPYCVDRITDGLTLEESTLSQIATSSNSGQAAIHLALVAGAKNIHLIGFDMNPDNAPLQDWYHSGHPENQGGHVYTRMRELMNVPAQYARNNDVRIINHNPNSAVTAFERAKSFDEWAEIKKEIPKRPIVISYYTDEFYAQHCLEMSQTAHFFGLTTHLYEMDSLDDWELNCLQKPLVIAQAMEDFPDDPILFVDSDARFRMYPSLFDNQKGHFGYCKFNWPEITNGAREDIEVSSAVLYLKNVAATRNLVSLWKDACERNIRDKAKVWDQKVLQKILSGYKWPAKDKVFEIPHSYNQIFDSMSHLGQPVIEQLQASRTARTRY